MKKYYYDCLIKALYMMKEFGVEFEIENEDFEDDDDGFTEPYFDFRLWDIESPECINSLLDFFNSNEGVYVQSGSDHIFEPRDWDLKNEQTGEIIMRDGKHFFMPKLELNK